MSKRHAPGRLGAEALEPRHLLAAQIVGHVWFDSDQSGSYGDSEVDVTDTEVRLLDSAGSILAEILSDKDGDFEFDGLPAGEYFVEVIPPDGTDFTMPEMAIEPLDSDVDPSTGRTAAVTLVDGHAEEITVGLVAPYGTAKITGRVWHDANANGIQDPGEAGIAYAEVQVENIHLEKILEVYTDENGVYEIDHTLLPPGSYVLDFKRPPRDGGLRWEVSPLSVAQVDATLNSDASTVNGKTELFYLEPADENSTPPDIELDVGFHRATYIRGYVQHLYALNRGYELAGFELRLLDAEEQVVATTETNKRGVYEFLGLAAGEYYIEAVLPDGVAATTDGMDPVSGRSAPLVVSSSFGQYYDVLVTTELGTDSLTGRLWHDINADGIQDPDEPGLEHRDFALENHRFSHVMEIRTDENGDYEVDGSSLFPGEYVLSLKYLVESIPTLDDFSHTWKIGPYSQGSDADPTKDSDFQSLSTRSKLIRLDVISSEAERGERRIDGGLYLFGSLSGRVWDDENSDGIWDDGERSVGRVAAELWNADNELVKTTHADLAGNFLFTELVPGNYTVQIVSPEGTSFSPQVAPNEATTVSEVDPVDGRATVFVPSAETVNITAGVFGNSNATEITGSVWDDVNGDGIRNVGESGMGGVTVELIDSQSRLLLSAPSSEDGSYRFTVSATDSYALRFVPPADATLSPMNRGSDDAVDSDVNRFTQRTSYFPLVGGQSASHIDAGIYQGLISSDARAHIRVSEVGFVGHGYSEFVEIKNVGDEPVSIEGVRFTDGVRFDFSTSATKSLFPGEHAVVVGETNTLAQRVELNEINVAGEYDGDLDRDEKLTLVDTADETIVSFRYDDDWFIILDSEFLPWTLTTVDETADPSAWELKSNWRPSSFLQGSPGTDDPEATPDPGTVVVNEVIAKSADGFNDLIEIHNTSDHAVDISNWYLGDSDNDIEPLVYLTRYRFPEGTVIAPHDYLVLTRELDFGNPDNPNAGFPFGLSSFGEGIHLIAADRLGNILGYSDSGVFEGSEVEDVFGRHVTQSGEAIFTQLSESTFGGPNAAPLIGDVLIDEIMYAPVDDGAEYFGIANASDSTIDLAAGFSPWTIDGAVRFDFPEGAELAPGGRALIVSTLPEVYRQENSVPDGVAVYGPFDGKLSNAGDDIRIYRFQTDAPRRFLVDQVSYRDDTPWPREADLGGVALVRQSLETVGNDPSNWTHSALPGDANLDGVVDGEDFNIWNQHRFTGYATWLVGDFDSDRDVDAGDFNIWNENRFRAVAGAAEHAGASRVPRAPLAAHVESAAVADLAFEDHQRRIPSILRLNRGATTSAITITDAVAADRAFDETSSLHRESSRHRAFDQPWSTYSVVHQQIDEAADERIDYVVQGQVVDRVLSDW